MTTSIEQNGHDVFATSNDTDELNGFASFNLQSTDNDAENTDLVNSVPDGHDTTEEDPEVYRQRAREFQWTEPQPYNYDTALANSGETAMSLPWFSKAKKYEWKDEYGDVAPRDEELEDELFHNTYITSQGDRMENLTKFSITVSGPITVEPIREFQDAGIHPLILENMKLCGYQSPTPIQCYALPAALQGNDVFGIAQAGSGKTGAYMIPILSKLAGKCLKLAAQRPGIGMPIDARCRAEPLVLILAPTRELVNQIFDHARRLCYRTMLRPCVAYGGGPVSLQREELQKGCDVLIASVGRLKDFAERTEILSLQRLRYIVFDEADELMQDDWGEDLSAIFQASRFGPHMQTMMFSATFGESARDFANKYAKAGAVGIEVGRVGSSHANITQHIKWIDEDLKKKALYDLLFSLIPARTLIFVNNKRTADDVDDFLFNRGLPSSSIHADRTQREREDSLVAFRIGMAPILVTTAVAARGIDVKAVHHVINYDLPPGSHGGIDEYVHRIGRTGRIGNEGLATSFFNDRDREIAPDLVKLLIENGQPVSKFLAEFLPAHYQVSWEDDEEEKMISHCATPNTPCNPEDAAFGFNGIISEESDIEELLLED